MAAAEGICFNHIARETNDVKRLAKFYQEILGFEQIESPDFGGWETIWLRIPPSFSLHIIKRNPESRLPEGPSNSTSAVTDPKFLPTAHHTCFSVSNFDSFVRSLKERGIETFEKSLPGGKVKQVFFFDPDGNGLEAVSQLSDCLCLHS